MSRSRNLHVRKMQLVLRTTPIVVALLITVSARLHAQQTPDFTGLWKQDNDRCQPKRNGDVTLQIAYRDSALAVETSIARSASNPRKATQKYVVGGGVSKSTGADGDTFYTSVAKENTNLVFSIEEHEDGRILSSKETWSLTDENSTLKRVRERSNNQPQILFYRRVQAFKSKATPAQSLRGDK